MNPSLPLQGPHLRVRFLALDAFLHAHQELWRPKPFTTPTLPWEARHPDLAQWLRARDLAAAEADHARPERLTGAPAPYPALAAEAAALTALAPFPRQPTPSLPSRFNVDVPGRKWQQIDAFAASLRFTDPVHHWLDWCAGKGHLGRRLAHDGHPLRCLEQDPDLVREGQRLSDRLGLEAEHLQQDVLAEDAAQRLDAHHTPVALHACGDLHLRLMRLADAAGCARLALAPCCYNRTEASAYQPLSQAGREAALALDREDLRLAISETVTAGARVRRQRDRSMAHRLGFDLLQRHLRSEDHYLPTPSLPGTWLERPFAEQAVALANGRLDLPATLDWAHWETAGWRRLAEVRNLELLRGLFRRPLELWLVLDRALYLEDRGYRVQVGPFCDQNLTPRNLLIVAER
ncbi:methyltransferase [Pseudomonas mangiferae]|uniref:methyltransferase n=1 Tax=Pseudomonas mangiferae TaxID=2593654 RepID=UPI001E5A1662|nr:methyltransferase [Pseudomonas mangiferae]